MAELIKEGKFATSDFLRFLPILYAGPAKFIRSPQFKQNILSGLASRKKALSKPAASQGLDLCHIAH
jgi:hypothetical protein